MINLNPLYLICEDLRNLNKLARRTLPPPEQKFPNLVQADQKEKDIQKQETQQLDKNMDGTKTDITTI